MRRALSILQAEQKPSTQYAYYELSEQELAKLVTRRGQVYTWTENERPRLSLAGAQDKCPVLIKNGACWLPKKESPSAISSSSNCPITATCPPTKQSRHYWRRLSVCLWSIFNCDPLQTRTMH